MRKVQDVARDIRPYAALSDHVLNNTSRDGDDKIVFVASW